MPIVSTRQLPCPGCPCNALLVRNDQNEPLYHALLCLSINTWSILTSPPPSHLPFPNSLCLKMHRLKPRGRSGFMLSNHHHPENTIFGFLKRLARRVRRRFCHFSCSESEGEEERTVRSYQPFVSEWEEWNRHDPSFVVRSARHIPGVKYEDIEDTDKNGLELPQLPLSCPSHWEENQSLPESSAAVSLVSMPIILPEPPELPGLLFERFTLRGLVREMPFEFIDDWIPLFQTQSNRTSQIIEGMGSQRSSILGLGGLFHGLSRSVSPKLHSNGVFSFTESPLHEHSIIRPLAEIDEPFLRAIPPPLNHAGATIGSDSNPHQQEYPPDFDWFLQCLFRESRVPRPSKFTQIDRT